jgi:predicted TIM-barrel fold metal-dependent hydrolase
MIIDSHIHYGLNSAWGNFYPEYTLDIAGDSIDYAICSNLEGIDSIYPKNELDCNLDMIRTAKKYKKLLPLAVCQVDKTLDNHYMKYLLSEYPQFIGLKFHPESMKLPANSPKYNKYLELAREFKKPCLFYSGNIRSKFSSPALIYEKAREYPDVPIILGHLSTGKKDTHIEATKIMLDSIETESANLYCDTSWMDPGTGDLQDVIELIEALKNTSKGDFTHRILWGSDAPIGDFNQSNKDYRKNLDNFRVKISSHFQDEKLVQNLLYYNARELYILY